MSFSFYRQGARIYDLVWRPYTRQTLNRTLEALNLKWLGQQQQQAQPARLLDIACGSGELALRLSRLLPELEITGLDNSQEMLEQARQKLAGSNRVLLVAGDANCALPFPSATFEAVVCANALHYLTRPARLLEEARRVLKPGGRLVIEDFTVHGRFFWPQFERVLRLFDPQHHKTYTLDELTWFVRQANLLLIDSATFQISLLWRGMVIVVTSARPTLSCRRLLASGHLLLLLQLLEDIWKRWSML